MKKKVLLSVLFAFVILTFYLVSAADSPTNLSDYAKKLSNAKSCVTEKTKDCSAISLEEKIFALLSNGACKAPLIEDSSNSGECWPSGSCSITSTSQAILALFKSGGSYSKAQDWLLTQAIPSTKIDWYIQIDTLEPAECKIEYSGSSPYTIRIDEEKKLSRGAGSCLILEDEYKLKVRNTASCYNTSFSISCDQLFLTTKLYKKTDGDTLYLSESVKSSAPGGVLTEKVDSSCFGQTSCNYKDSLWATFALSASGKNVSSYLPYLITFADEPENQKYLPNAFLYILTNSQKYRTDLLAQQKTVSGQSYWDVSGNRFYDSAIALLPFSSNNAPEKTNAVSWLLKVQGADGCWNSGNIRDTAFIIYSLEGSKSSSPSTQTSCSSLSGFCLNQLECTNNGGTKIEGGACSGVSICCNKPLPTCAEKAGNLCKSDEKCPAGSELVVSDSSTCCEIACVKVTPKDPVQETCTKKEGTCKTKCSSGEEEIDETCSYSEDVCCVEKNSINSGLIIILLFLIVLVILGIVFKKNLRDLILKLKSKKFLKKDKGDSPKGASSGNLPPRPPRSPPYGPGPGMQMPRRPIQQQPMNRPVQPSAAPNQFIQRRIVKQQTHPDVEEVLKKLREMGK